MLDCAARKRTLDARTASGYAVPPTIMDPVEAGLEAERQRRIMKPQRRAEHERWVDEVSAEKIERYGTDYGFADHWR